MEASNKDKHSQSWRARSRATDVNESKPAASKQSRDTTSQPKNSARWTRNEYQALIDNALREYTTAGSAATVTEANANARDSQRGLRGGGDNDKGTNVGAKRATRTAVDTDQLDRKPSAQPRLRAEQQQTIIPQENDILFGRKHQKNHAGNQYLRKLCDEQRSVYNFSDRDDKTEMTRDLVKHIAAIGGRFLKFRQSHKSWVEVNEEDARLKVAHVMRDGRPQPLGRLEPEMFPPVRCKNHSKGRSLPIPLFLTLLFHRVCM